MAPKNTKNAPGHDDVSSLFARLGTQASEGYHDFAYTQLPPRKPDLTHAEAQATAQAAPPAPEAALAPVHVPASASAATSATAGSVAASALGEPPAAQPSLAMHRAAPADQAANGSLGDALAPLRKLRRGDEPGAREQSSQQRPVQTPLEQLFQRLLQADARSAAQSPLQRLRSR
ncbi:hypothetical protein [Xanthomonas vesicatoria]|uniref:hypothetical protein n=1 Tax=Xanthomonas vesicatoria TaxID=56460 RepID=UPI0007324107|nr:hypothetical protein [Xanthomonas vesicatoria]KTF38094.1 hypothetical protein LMG919_04560 [Xanthomonas vesicatoria]MCC8557513.1 hypothetical protein [Xanthomonas vesicatoria]MCC8601272.1 hypothetical protein [Xanthomonas vesicatoria]MCC8608966.1 hypothetical protein [Xanthomonas vesicatoria]MCC8619740.1 hypothetical protein [Xanthomonas vesicatoria]